MIEIQGENHGMDLQHATVPVHEPEPQPGFIGLRLAHNAVDMLSHLVEYVTVSADLSLSLSSLCFVLQWRSPPRWHTPIPLSLLAYTLGQLIT
jgi:hypothetical protein